MRNEIAEQISSGSGGCFAVQPDNALLANPHVGAIKSGECSFETARVLAQQAVAHMIACEDL
jgi:hypothetical protein